MVKVESRSGDHWCTTEDVRDKIKIPQKGSEKDFQQAIEGATNSVQSWFKRETGESDLPDPEGLDDLLVEATAWLAASESTFSYGRNFSENGGQSGRVSTAEGKAEQKFQEWSDERDVSEGEAATEGSVNDVGAQSGALIDEF